MAMMTKRKKAPIEGRSVSMYPSDWRLVEMKGKELGIGVSAVLRLIVRRTLAPDVVESRGDGSGQVARRESR